VLETAGITVVIVGVGDRVAVAGGEVGTKVVVGAVVGVTNGVGVPASGATAGRHEAPNAVPARAKPVKNPT
jgi:hypothetical protein